MGQQIISRECSFLKVNVHTLLLYKSLVAFLSENSRITISFNLLEWKSYSFKIEELRECESAMMWVNHSRNVRNIGMPEDPIAQNNESNQMLDSK